MFIFANKHPHSHRILLGLLVGVGILISTVMSVLVASPTFARMTTDTKPSERAMSYSYAKGLAKCVQNHMRSDIRGRTSSGETAPSQGPENFNWFDNLTANVSVFPDGSIECVNLMSKGMSLWGWTDNKQFLQDIGYTYNGTNNMWSRNNDAQDRANDFLSAVNAKSGNITNLLDGAAEYALYLGVFNSESEGLSRCNAQPLGLLSSVDETTRNAATGNQSVNGKNYTVIKTYDPTAAEMVDQVFSYSKETEGITNYASAWSYRGANRAGSDAANAEKYTCEDIVNRIKTNAPLFGRWNDNHSDNLDTIPGVPTATEAACAADGTCDTEQTTSCAVEGVGWMVCPITNFMSGIGDGAYAVIKSFLVVNVSVYSSDSGTFVAWSTFRNIANVMFVIVFLVIIFSQLTGQGVSNYGVKKTLPRLIITVILVNASFYICQIAVDITQIIGGGAIDLLKAIPVGTGEESPLPTWSAITGDILMGTLVGTLAIAGIVGGAVAVALSISLPVLLAFLLAVLMTAIILIGRQAAIVILIVIAPIAFVLYLLPNTEQWFKRWMKMFWGLLLVYPIVALLYGGGSLTARIISNIANDPLTTGESKFWLSIVALGVSAIPLLFTPVLLRNALNSTGKVGAKLSGAAGKANSNIKQKALTESRFGEARQGLKNRFALQRARRRSESGLQQAIDNSRVGRAIGLDKGSRRALSLVNEEFEHQVKDAALSQTKYDIPTLEAIATTGRDKDDKPVSDAYRAAAIDKVMSAGGFNNRRAVLEAMASNKSSTTAELRSRAVSAAYAKGDANIYGTSFGDKIVQQDGSINSREDLERQALGNIAGGSLSAEHIVQGEGSTKYLVDIARRSEKLIDKVKLDEDEKIDVEKKKAMNAAVKTNISAAALKATQSSSTAPKVTTAISESFKELGVSPSAATAQTAAAQAMTMPAQATSQLAQPITPTATPEPTITPDGGLTIPHGPAQTVQNPVVTTQTPTETVQNPTTPTAQSTPTPPVDPYDQRINQQGGTTAAEAAAPQMTPEWQQRRDEQAKEQAQALQPDTPQTPPATPTNPITPTSNVDSTASQDNLQAPNSTPDPDEYRDGMNR